MNNWVLRSKLPKHDNSEISQNIATKRSKTTLIPCQPPSLVYFACFSTFTRALFLSFCCTTGWPPVQTWIWTPLWVGPEMFGTSKKTAWFVEHQQRQLVYRKSELGSTVSKVIVFHCNVPTRGQQHVSGFKHACSIWSLNDSHV